MASLDDREHFDFPGWVERVGLRVMDEPVEDAGSLWET